MVMLDDGGSGSALIGRLEERGVAVLAVEGAPDAEELTRTPRHVRIRRPDQRRLLASGPGRRAAASGSSIWPVGASCSVGA